jgi:hypothetical protein
MRASRMLTFFCRQIIKAFTIKLLTVGAILKARVFLDVSSRQDPNLNELSVSLPPPLQLSLSLSPSLSPLLPLLAIIRRGWKCLSVINTPAFSSAQ